MEDRVKRIEKALDHFLPERKGSLSEAVTDAMRYSLLNGGNGRDYADFIAPVFVMNAVKRSLDGGNEEKVNEFEL